MLTSILMVEVIRSSKTSVALGTEATLRHMPEDGILQLQYYI
jgi:hypothetical protein